MTLKETRNALLAGSDLEAFVYAADPAIYLLQVSPSGNKDQPPVTITDSKGNTLVYRSRYAADQACARAGFAQVTLVHESAYGEMVGLPAGGDTRLQQTYPIKVDSRS